MQGYLVACEQFMQWLHFLMTNFNKLIPSCWSCFLRLHPICKLKDLNIDTIRVYTLFKKGFWQKKSTKTTFDIMLVVVRHTYTYTFSFWLPSVVLSPPNPLYFRLDGVLQCVCRPIGLATFCCLKIMPELYWLQPSAVTHTFGCILSTRRFHNTVKSLKPEETTSFLM